MEINESTFENPTLENKKSESSPLGLHLKVHQRVALAIVFLVGCVFVLASELNLHSWPDWLTGIIRETGILFVSVTPVVLIYENILRHHMHSEMERSIKEAIEQTQLEKKVLTTISKTIPSGIQNLMSLGISDACSGLTVENIKVHLDRLKPDSIVTVSNIYIPSLKFAQASEFIFSDAIRKGCRFNILLHDPDDTLALTKRLKAANDGSTIAEYQSGIDYNLRFLFEEWKKLSASKKRNSINIRLHNNYLSISSWGFGEYYIIGNYLYGKSAVRGTHLRVDKHTLGDQSTFFIDLERNFDSQWKMAQKQVDFSKNGPGGFNKDAIIQPLI